MYANKLVAFLFLISVKVYSSSFIDYIDKSWSSRYKATIDNNYTSSFKIQLSLHAHFHCKSFFLQYEQSGIENNGWRLDLSRPESAWNKAKSYTTKDGHTVSSSTNVYNIVCDPCTFE